MSSTANGNEDADRLYIEKLMDTLYEFDNGPASKKKLKSQRKKKRKHLEEEGEEEVEDSCRDGDEDDGATHNEQQLQPETEQRGAPVRQVEVVTFQDPRKKLKSSQTPVLDKTPAAQITEKKKTTTKSDQREEISLEKARLEVHRFGITGYKKEQQRVFEQDRAVMLGARPPKKGYVNYKVLQQQIKDKKQKAKEEVNRDLKKKKKKPSNPRDKKRVSSGPSSGSAPTGQVGRFKNGMLILSSKEIQTIKGSKKRK